MDPVRDQARKFAAIVIAVAVVTLALFETIAHRGVGRDAPGVIDSSTTPGTPVPAPGQP